MAHWHDFNPWADRIVYLPDLEELSALLNPLEPTRYLERWMKEHPDGKLDAYILPQPSKFHSCGVRWGREGHEYYSPGLNRYAAELLLAKYRNAGAP